MNQSLEIAKNFPFSYKNKIFLKYLKQEILKDYAKLNKTDYKFK